MRVSGKHVPHLLLAAVVLILGAGAPEASAKKNCKEKEEISLSEARIYWEYNSSGPDLGVHVFLDGEDWKSMKIFHPNGKLLFSVEGKQGYKELGMTELFFEGAEPNLNDVELQDLLDLFPEGEYEFEGLTVDGNEIEGEADFSHAIPDGPDVSDTGDVSGSTLIIKWDPVDSPPDGFPDEEITIVGYQVIVDSFEVTLPSTATQCTVPPEFVDSLDSGEHVFEVLAIEESGNQSITEGTFTK
jgi:hypothetical protein